MSETSGFSTVESAENADTGNETPVENQGQGQDSTDSGGHPAWEEILSREGVPEPYKPLLRKTFQEWDEGVEHRLQTVQSQYEPYKPFLENEIDPNELERAYQVARMIEQNPQGFYQRMGEFYGYNKAAEAPAQNSGQGQQGDDDYDEYDISDGDDTPDPKFSQLEQQQEMLAQALVQMHQKEQNAQEDAELETELSRLRETKGEYDEQFVLNVAANNGGNVEAAVDKYFELVAKVQGAPRPGTNFPKVVSPSGGAPTTPVNPAELDRKGTKDYALQILQQMNQQE